MINRLKNINDRLRSVGKNDDGTIFESHALWNDPRRNGSYARRQRAIEDFYRWSARDAFYRRLYGLFDRIRRKLHGR